jgi:2-keto-4-pentenoate hydratase/2-oxohepta-3-ene-1,7-dioic acid hydratase in catechol pathway
MRLGVLADGRIVAVGPGDVAVDVTAVLPGEAAIERLSGYPSHVDAVQAAVEAGPRLSLWALPLDAPSPRPRTLLAAPVNFAPHKGELGDRSPDKGKLDARQMGLIVLAPASVTGPRGAIELPDLPGREFHYEGEIAVVIGKPAHGVTRAEALEHVLGYTGLLDITMRIGPQGQEDRSMRKSFHTFTPIGPLLLTADEVPDPAALSLELSLNGEVRQRGALDQLIVDVPDLVAKASQMVPLEPGDVIATGTPAGVGAFRPGDTVTLTVPGVGELIMDVRRRAW